MALSTRASALLASFPRHPYVGSARTMEYVFAKAGLPLFEPVIAFQQQYAGYRLSTTHYRLFPGLLCGVVHHKPLPPTRNPLIQLWRLSRPRVHHRYSEYRVDDYHLRVSRYKNQWFFACTDDSFEGQNYIDEKGVFYHDYIDDHYFRPSRFASSMDKYIEKEAFIRTVIGSHEHMQYLCSIAKANANWDELATKWRLVKDEDASDDREQFWYSESLVAEVRVGSINFWSTPLLDEPRKQWLLRIKR